METTGPETTGKPTVELSLSQASVSHAVKINSFPQVDIVISANFPEPGAIKFNISAHEFVDVAPDNAGLLGSPVAVHDALDLVVRFIGAMLAGAYTPPDEAIPDSKTKILTLGG